MPRSLREVLDWYQKTVYALSHVINKDSVLDKQLIGDLIVDGGARAKEAIEALDYCKYETSYFDRVLSCIVYSVKKTGHNAEAQGYAEEAIILINKLKELCNKLVSNNVLEFRSNFDQVVKSASDELVSIYGNKINGQAKVMCRHNHTFLTLPDHPILNDKPVCPHCMFSEFIKTNK